MNNYGDLYNSKLTTVDGALSKIKSGDVVAISCYGSEPITILEQLHTIKDRVENVTIWHLLGYWKYKFLEDNPEYLGKFDIMATFYGPAARNLHKTGRVSYQPNHVRDMVPKRVVNQKPDVFIATVSPMDKNGYVRESISLLMEHDAWKNAGKIIVEVNRNVPLVYGDTEIHISDIDCIVESNRPLISFPNPPMTDVDLAIGEYVSSIVKDGDCIQLGYGPSPNACAKAFMSKKDLGVHTEMISESMMELMRAGVVTNRKKNFHKDKMVGAFVFGSEDLYRFVDNNPCILLKPGSYTNDLRIISQNDNMVAINSALMVDLSGQVNSESINGRQYGGTGGQNDMAIGSVMSKNGKSVTILPSTTAKGKLSTIQPFLPFGSTVSVTRNDVDYVVTEYGIAHLRGKTIRERAKCLISIAHPDFRKELQEAAKKYEIW